MLGPLRTLISVAFLVVLVWAAFSVKLGDRTFADHMDRIGETDEARALLAGARARIRPALEEVKQRLIGEYVEAPTHLPAPPPRAPAVRTDGTSTADSGRLPGRKLPGALTGRPREPDTDELPRHKPRSAASAPDTAGLPGRKPRDPDEQRRPPSSRAPRKTLAGQSSADSREPQRTATPTPTTPRKTPSSAVRTPDAGKLPGRRAP